MHQSPSYPTPLPLEPSPGLLGGELPSIRRSAWFLVAAVGIFVVGWALLDCALPAGKADRPGPPTTSSGRGNGGTLSTLRSAGLGALPAGSGAEAVALGRGRPRNDGHWRPRVRQSLADVDTNHRSQRRDVCVAGCFGHLGNPSRRRVASSTGTNAIRSRRGRGDWGFWRLQCYRARRLRTIADAYHGSFPGGSSRGPRDADERTNSVALVPGSGPYDLNRCRGGGCPVSRTRGGLAELVGSSARPARRIAVTRRALAFGLQHYPDVC